MVYTFFGGGRGFELLHISRSFLRICETFVSSDRMCAAVLRCFLSCSLVSNDKQQKVQSGTIKEKLVYYGLVKNFELTAGFVMKAPLCSSKMFFAFPAYNAVSRLEGFWTINRSE